MKRCRMLLTAVVAAFITCGCSQGVKSVGKLRCEYLDNPLGIDMLTPRLSWKMASDKRGQKQTAYRILVLNMREIVLTA